MTDSERELRSLTKQRSSLKGSVTRFKNYLDKLEPGCDIQQLKRRFSEFETSLAQFQHLQHEISMLSDVDDEELEKFEDEYYNVCTRAEELISSSNSHVSRENSSAPADARTQGETSRPQIAMPAIDVRLPSITLQTFSGDFDQWLSFRDNFQALIGSIEHLPDVQKFLYLKSSLSGQALQTVANLEATSANYGIAWDLLVQQYEKPDIIIHKHVSALFNLSPVTKESHITLRSLVNDAKMHLRALQALGEPVEHWDTLIVYLLTTKLDFTTRREWEQFKSSNSTGNLNNLLQIIENRCYFQEKLHIQKNVSPNTATFKVNTQQPRQRMSYVSVNEPHCPLCKGSHNLYQCDQFNKLTPVIRLNEVKKLRLCINCLRRGPHKPEECTFGSCKKCGAKHNTLLHLANRPRAINSPSNRDVSNRYDSPEPEQQHVSVNCCHSNYSQVLLSTAIINVLDNAGKSHSCRCLLDSASESSFATSKFIRKLKLGTVSVNVPIRGISQKLTTVTEKCTVTIKSRVSDFQSKLNCLIVDKITEKIPTTPIDIRSFKVPEKLALADPTFDTPGGIDILIGAELFFSLLLNRKIDNDSLPVLQLSQFGWLISGPVPSTKYPSSQDALPCLHSIGSLDVPDISQFWEVEETPFKFNFEENHVCETHFLKNFSMSSDGRFTVALPQRENCKTIGESRQIALNRFHWLERKLNSRPDLQSQYVSFMREYISLGHMSPIDEWKFNNRSVYYLPHHPVIKTDSETTKLRVVFDGSCPSSNGVSLNDTLLVGPNIQQDIFSILTRFRTHAYAFTADIEKMYRQVDIRSSDRHLQRIFWRESADKPLECYVLNTVTYGLGPSSFLAARCLRQIAKVHSLQYPVATERINRDFYVDDLLTGANSLEEATVLRGNIAHLLASHGFQLRKWVSNKAHIIKTEAHSNDHIKKFEFGDENCSKTLGMHWNASDDVLLFHISTIVHKVITKRAILSTISHFYDPTGIAGPVVLLAKIIIQKLWQLRLNWDVPVPLEIQGQWTEFARKIHSLNNLHVPRHLQLPHTVSVALHGFCDGSMSAYGGVVYMRSRDNMGNTLVRLVCSKSRVAPLKPITIPRLELCGALLLAQLMNKIKDCIYINIEECFYWTDSTIVLGWLKASPCILNVFVANRVAEIQRISPVDRWNHISGSTNPADIISRGQQADLLLDNDLWWEGPKWLRQENHFWPSQQPDYPDALPEVRKNIKSAFITLIDVNFVNYIFERFSSLSKLKRVVAYCYRFSRNIRILPSERNFGPLTAMEVEFAMTSLIKLSQAQEFPCEIDLLRKNKPLSSNSKLLSLNPIIDSQGLLRVGGRLRHAIATFSQKHPIILPRRHPLTKLIIHSQHIELLHAGVETVLAALRNEYWPIAGRSSIKSIVRRCITCFKSKPLLAQPLMGDLPSQRVNANPARPFTVCGIDYAGPYYVKEGIRKTISRKGYLCIFVCFSTKAVHLELVGDLTTQAFLAALRRFISRRGCPRELHSDNATNFVGASRELNKVLSCMLPDETVQAFVSKNSITWHFIPSRSATFGCLWEANIKSVKRLLSRILNNNPLSYEELYTVFTQVEACLNSRPLTAISTDPNDLTPLTPAHFLVGDSLQALPEKQLLEERSLLRRFQRVQHMAQQFWKRWYHEYVTSLQQRTKWKRGVHCSIKVGDLVLIRDSNLAQMKWSLGRVVELHPGDDDISRVASVKTISGVTRRAVNKLAILPCDD